MKPTTALRKKLDNWKQKPIVAPGVHDPYCARIAERLGFDTLYMGGAATSMSRLGMADFGLATATEVIGNAKYITSITDLPLIADSDNGYGNAVNTMRTVKDYIRAGVAGIHIEDQVIPKRCGHLKGKMVVSLDEMVGKIKAAKKVIKEEDPDFVLIARTDARGAVGGGLDDAVERLKACWKAGADLVFADGLTSKDELETICSETRAPTVFHPTAISPRLSVKECHKMGVALMIYPFASMHAMSVAVWDFLARLKDEDTRAQVEFEERYKDHPLSDLRKLFDLGGLKEFQAYEREFIPAEEVKAKYGKQTVGI
ncbi:MAG TPA: isocitrate lyase/PEP mutase family protein [Nitrososphaerales archaeon]|nr:isocitrate lyase/PEP mutase family protein [Nitrososphaerales archaeon]